MKESILNRLKKYNTGGDWDKAGSLALKTAKYTPGLAGTLGSRFLGPLSLMLGATKSYATPVYDKSGVHRFTGEYLGTGEPLPTVDVNQVNQQLSKAMAPKLQMGGVQPLPGGAMHSIPGTDAVEFSGQTHDEGGIMMDNVTEVEDGETMDQVVMKGGGPRDYFFSSHLKKGGMSYADMHKDILQNGGTQQEINMLAKMQEKAAGRDSTQVAKLGGIMKYGKGGYMKYDEGGGRINLEQIRSMYPQYATDIQNLQNYNPNISAEENRLNENMRKGNYLYDDSDITYVDTDDLAPYYVDTPMPSADNPYAAASMEELFRKQGPIDRSDDQSIIPLPSRPLSLMPTQPFLSNYTVEKKYRHWPTVAENMAATERRIALNKQYEGELSETAKGDTYDAYLAGVELSGEIPEGGTLSEKEWNKQKRKQDRLLAKQERKLQNILNPGMPTAAKIGAAAQFLPALTAMLTKQKDPEQFEYTPGFTSPIVAGRVKGLKYEAPTQDEARARLASSYLGQQRFLDTAGAGAAGLSNRQALFAKKLAAEGTLGAQEAKDKITAENLTKKSQELADARNVQNELQAATTNAQMIQREADRKAAVDNANIQLRNMIENEKVANRMAIASNLASGIAGVTGDMMSYKAQERLAEAMGGDGIYQRDLLSNYLSKQPENKNKTKDEINQMVLKILS